MRIEVITGTEARELLAQDVFLAQWDALQARCPWATAFQSHRFARVWYQTYHDAYEPVFVVARDEDSTLRGLLALAQLTSDGSLVVAGWEQAEYHTWLCAPEDGNTFPLRAIRALRQSFPKAPLQFRYLAPGTPLRWLKSAQGRRYCVIKPYRRPLLRLGDGSEIVRSLKKSSNKSRLKRMEKLGGFEFRRVTDPAEYESLFQRIVTLYDLRHGAVQGSDPFCTTPRQKEFHVAMMKAGLLHATVMKVGGEMAAAHWGVMSGPELQLGTIVHDPLLAKHSPGKFQVLLLAQMMHEEGFERFDLTPGGDSYKERFANDADEAHALLVLPTPSACARARLHWRAMEAAKGWLSRHGLTPAEARYRMRQLRHPGRVMDWMVRAVRERAWSSRELHVFLRDHPAPLHSRAGITVHRNALEDLLLYHPSDGGESRQTFLSRALRRLEAGQHCYTVTDGGRLRCSVWLDGQPAPLPEGIDNLPGFSLPPNSALIHDIRMFGAPSSAPPLTDVLRVVSADAAMLPGVRQTVLIAPGDHEALLSSARRLAFRHVSTLICVARLGRIGWMGLHTGNDLLPRRPSAADLAASATLLTAVSKRAKIDELEAAGAV